jgi:hypothetical protein
MKRFIFALMTAGILLGCQKSDQAVAEKLIYDYLQTNLNNPQSYKPIKFSEVFTDYYNTYYSEDSYKENIKKFATARDSLIKLGQTQKAAEVLKAIDDERQKMEYDREHFVSEIAVDALYVIHSYRAESETGAVKKYVYLYRFDTELTEMIQAEPLDSYIKYWKEDAEFFGRTINDDDVLGWAIKKVETDNDFKPAIAD